MGSFGYCGFMGFFVCFFFRELLALDEQAIQQESEFKAKSKEVGFLQMKAKQYSSSLEKTKVIFVNLPNYKHTGA